jgi:hypothetical protein
MAIERLNKVQWLRRQYRYERNILAVFTRATASDIVDGIAWYPYASQTLATIAPDWTVEKRAAVCAILSPRVTWKENITGFGKLHKAALLANRLPPVMAGLNRNIAKAHDVALDARGINAVSGPKVSCFYANLSGNLERVTLDVWAGRAAGLTEAETDKGIRGKRYEYLEKAYVRVARELGFKPAELQAICWVVVRGKGE